MRYNLWPEIEHSAYVPLETLVFFPLPKLVCLCITRDFYVKLAFHDVVFEPDLQELCMGKILTIHWPINVQLGF